MFENKFKNIKIANHNVISHLEQVLIDGQSDNGRVKIVVDGNKKVRQILISQELFDEGNKESIEVFTQIAINIALKKVDIIYNELMKKQKDNAK